jgi:hypothetical protein
LQIQVEKKILKHTVNPNPVELTAFPCKSIPTGKTLLSLQGNPVLIAGSLFLLQSFPCISLYFPVMDCSAIFKKRVHFFHERTMKEYQSLFSKGAMWECPSFFTRSGSGTLKKHIMNINS